MPSVARPLGSPRRQDRFLQKTPPRDTSSHVGGWDFEILAPWLGRSADLQTCFQKVRLWWAAWLGTRSAFKAGHSLSLLRGIKYFADKLQMSW